MSTLTNLWRALEHLPTLAAVDAEWSHLLGTDYDLARPFLRPTCERAASYPRLDGGLPYDVIRHGEGDIVGVCPESGRTIKLCEEQLIVYELDRRLLAQRIAKAFGIDTTGANEECNDRLIRLGRIVPADVRYDCYLVIPEESGDVDVAVLQLVAQGRTPCILFVTTWSCVRSTSETQLRQQRSILVALSDVMASERPGTLLVATPLTSFLGKGRGDSAPGDNSQILDGNRNIFRFEEGVWKVRFSEKTLYLPESLGLSCIARLLASKGRNVNAAALKSAARGGAPFKPLAGIEALDAEARKRYESEYRRLTEELEEAREFQDLAKQAEMQEKLAFLARELDSATGLGGRTRKVSDEASKVRTSVKNAITCAIDKQIKPKHKALAGHLDQSLRTGTTLSYEPEPDVEWDL